MEQNSGRKRGNFPMREKIEELYSILGSHNLVAEALEYSPRQYLNIRKKIMENLPIQPRIEALISWKLKELKENSFVAKKG